MIGTRLKEERERLGLTQPVFAELAGAKKRTLIDWEGSVSSPTAVQIAALSKHGVDVLYVLTGQRNAALPPSSAPAVSNMNADETELLAWYRESHPVIRRSVKAALKEAASHDAGTPASVTKPPARNARKRAV